jgi:hypothetical protein
MVSDGEPTPEAKSGVQLVPIGSCLLRVWHGPAKEAGPSATRQYYSIAAVPIAQMR